MRTGEFLALRYYTKAKKHTTIHLCTEGFAVLYSFAFAETTMENTSSKLEALLFIYGDPLPMVKAAKLLGISAKDLAGAVSDLKNRLMSSGSGLAIVEHDQHVQLVTKPEFGKLLEKVLKAELREQLTPAALETLSIITYAGPIGRAEIDYIRGVNSTFSIRALLLRGLIARETDPGRPNAYRYSPSIDLLHHLGITSLADLPEYDRFHSLVTKLQPAATAPDIAVVNKTN